LKGEHIDPGFTDFIEFFETATENELTQMEQRLKVDLPEVYRQFLQCSNGLLIGENYFPGTRDARLAPFPDDSFPPTLYLTDEIINNLADGFYCLPLEGENQLQVLHFDQYGEQKRMSNSLQEFLHLKLETLPNQYLNYCDLLRTA
ncbi:MAG: SMI1/KNR4 family protein, partial [Planctomycetaceae bacterium]|nr:SMI1/KNR4 family protein [Planctomycetaceae bacterium]